jgi:hypothetical protein
MVRIFCIRRKEKYPMRRAFLVALVIPIVGFASICAQDKPARTSPQEKPSSTALPSKPLIVVNVFATTKEVTWPYEMKDLQKQTVAEMNAKAGTEYEVAAEVPAAPRARQYTLNGEVTAWHPGNRAKRMLVGMGSGRETAEIHYWLTDEGGKCSKTRTPFAPSFGETPTPARWVSSPILLPTRLVDELRMQG